jgi:plastocyanin
MNFFRVTVCGLAIAAIGWGCGDGDSNSNPSGPSTATGPTISIVGQNGTQAFTPNPASFGGQTVVFKNNDSIPHRVVLNDNSIDTGDIAPGATSRAVLMPTSGTNYHCTIHPGMIGSVGGGTGAAPPMCEGIYCSPY